MRVPRHARRSFANPGALRFEAQVCILRGDARVNADTHKVPLSEVMSAASYVAAGDSSVESLIALITEHHIGCVPIVDAQHRPIGIVTKLDLVECREDDRKTARDVMMPHAMALTTGDTLARAATLMSREGFHHLLIVDDAGTLRGVLSTFDVTRWVARLTDPT